MEILISVLIVFFFFFLIYSLGQIISYSLVSFNPLSPSYPLLLSCVSHLSFSPLVCFVSTSSSGD